MSTSLIITIMAFRVKILKHFPYYDYWILTVVCTTCIISLWKNSQATFKKFGDFLVPNCASGFQHSGSQRIEWLNPFFNLLNSPTGLQANECFLLKLEFVAWKLFQRFENDCCNPLVSSLTKWNMAFL
jgi:hypothetical protein